MSDYFPRGKHHYALVRGNGTFIYLSTKMESEKASEQLLEPNSKYCIDIFPVFSMYLFGL